MKLLLFIFAAVLAGCQAAPTEAPRSSLPRVKAAAMAAAIADQVRGDVLAIEPTGSMRPTFGANAFVVVERAAWGELNVGDIVVYRTRAGLRVIHRLYQRHGDSWLILGDANGSCDVDTVRRDNLQGRVCAIFYTES